MRNWLWIDFSDDAPWRCPNRVRHYRQSGIGMNMIPRARFDDGLLHVLAVTSGLVGLAAMAASAFLGGNRMGQYNTCHRLRVKLDRPLMLQTDGNTAWESREFTFTLLPKALKIKY